MPKLWSINPANGSATEIASPPSGAYNNSGLAVIPVGAAPLGVGPVDGVPKPLLHAVPNPTRGAVSLRLEVDGMSWARVFDASGRLVRTLAGEASGHEIVWDGRTEAGAPVRGGVYFVEAGGATARARRKIIVLE